MQTNDRAGLDRLLDRIVNLGPLPRTPAALRLFFRGLSGRDDYLVAREGFTVDGERVAKGERVSADHEFVTKRPEMFRAESGSRGAVTPKPRTTTPRAMPRTDGRPAGWLGAWPPPLDVELRTTPTPVTVNLSQSARRTIIDLARDSRDGLETGGALFGPKPWSHRPLAVRTATDAGPNAKRSATSFAFDPEHNVAWADQLARESDGNMVSVGSWHTHPSHDDTTPSDSDLQTWARLVEALQGKTGTGRQLAIIVTPDPVREWSAPHLTAWVVRRKGEDRPHASDETRRAFVCEPVRLG